ncbi:MarR family winged helix-turn-helix transcriptional regulator, partial [Cryptosporangium minutisporangium]
MELRTLFDDLVRLETVLWNVVDARLRDACDLTLGSLDVLRVIDRTPECRVQEVADALAITVGGASQAVDRIERQGLCARHANPKNRRSSVLRLTPAGRERTDEALAVFDAALADVLGDALSAADRAAFTESLRTLRAAATA